MRWNLKWKNTELTWKIFRKNCRRPAAATWRRERHWEKWQRSALLETIPLETCSVFSSTWTPWLHNIYVKCLPLFFLFSSLFFKCWGYGGSFYQHLKKVVVINSLDRRISQHLTRQADDISCCSSPKDSIPFCFSLHRFFFRYIEMNFSPFFLF